MNIYWNVPYPNWFYVYVTRPESILKYKILLDKPFKIGNKLPKKIL